MARMRLALAPRSPWPTRDFERMSTTEPPFFGRMRIATSSTKRNSFEVVARLDHAARLVRERHFEIERLDAPAARRRKRDRAAVRARSARGRDTRRAAARRSRPGRSSRDRAYRRVAQRVLEGRRVVRIGGDVVDARAAGAGGRAREHRREDARAPASSPRHAATRPPRPSLRASRAGREAASTTATRPQQPAEDEQRRSPAAARRLEVREERRRARRRRIRRPLRASECGDRQPRDANSASVPSSVEGVAPCRGSAAACDANRTIPEQVGCALRTEEARERPGPDSNGAAPSRC